MENVEIVKLVIFKRRDKFSAEAWSARGLNPSDENVCRRLEIFFNRIANKLIKNIEEGGTVEQNKNLLKQHLFALDSSGYDTEEKEFICDLFFELSTVLKVQFEREVQKWLYDNELYSYREPLPGKQAILETYSQNCEVCDNKLESFVIDKEESIPAMDWLIVRCKSCKGYNIINLSSGIKQLKFGDYIVVEQLPKSKFTVDAIRERMEQLKNSKYN